MPPKDGQRVLLQYYDQGFNYHSQRYERYPEPKWEECWWCDKDLGGSDPHWQPWCGTYKSRSTKHILDEDVVNWRSLGNG